MPCGSLSSHSVIGFVSFAGEPYKLAAIVNVVGRGSG
jgi:hypothetical protein